MAKNVKIMRDSYTIVKNLLIRDPNLDYADRMRLIIILSLPQTWHFNRMGLVKLLEFSSVQVLDRYLKRLITFGYLRKIRYKNKYFYYFFESSILIDNPEVNYLGKNGFPRKLTDKEVEKLDKSAYILCKRYEDIAKVEEKLMRRLPEIYRNKQNEAKEEPKKRKTPKEAAIERTQKRKEILEKFCEKYNVDTKSELCKNIKKILNSPKTKNISLAEYKQQLKLIGEAIPIIGEDNLALSVGSNAIKGYMRLIYDSQLQVKKEKKLAKDNIKTDEPTKRLKDCTSVEDFDDYRPYLDNPSDDEELKDFVLEYLNIDLRAYEE